MKNASSLSYVRRFFGWLTLWSYLSALLSPTFANIFAPFDPVPLPVFQDGLKMHVEPFDAQTIPLDRVDDAYGSTLKNPGFKLSLSPVLASKSSISSLFPSKSVPLVLDVLAVDDEDTDARDIFLRDDDASDDDSFDHTPDARDDDGDTGYDTLQNDQNSPLASTLILPGSQTTYQAIALGSKDHTIKDSLHHIVKPGLADVAYDNVFELFENTVSAGFSWRMEGIGTFSLLWNGQAYLDGSGIVSDQPLSLDLNLKGSVHLSNVSLRTLTVKGADVYVSDQVEIDDLRVLKEKDDPSKEVMIEKDATLTLQTLVSDHPLSNKGTLAFKEYGRLHLKETLFVNQGTMTGKETVIVDGARHMLQEGHVDVKSLRVDAKTFDNKGLLEVYEGYISAKDRLDNGGTMKGGGDLRVVSDNILTNYGSIESLSVLTLLGKTIDNTKDNTGKVGRISGKNHLDVTFEETLLNQGSLNSARITLQDKGQGTLTNEGAITAKKGEFGLHHVVNGEASMASQTASILFQDKGDLAFQQHTPMALTNYGRIVLGAQTANTTLNELQNHGEMVHEGKDTLSVDTLLNQGSLFSKGSFSLKTGKNKGHMALSNAMTVQTSFDNENALMLHDLHGQGGLNNKGSLTFHHTSQPARLTLQRFINQKEGTIQGDTVISTRSNQHFRNDHEGTITLKDFTMEPGNPFSSFSNEGHLNVTKAVIDRFSIRNKGDILSKSLSLKGQTLVNEKEGDMESDDLSLAFSSTITNKGMLTSKRRLETSAHTFLNEGWVTAKDFLSSVKDTFTHTKKMTVGNVWEFSGKTLTNKGEMQLHAANLKTSFFLNDGPVTSKDMFYFRGDTLTNNQEMRFSKSDVFCQKQLLNHKNIHVIGGNTKAMHLLNRGTIMFGGTLQTPIPTFQGTVDDLTTTYKPYTLENRGLILEHAPSNQPFLVEGKHVQNDGDVVAHRVIAHVGALTNTKTIDVKQMMEGVIEKVENRGTWIVGASTLHTKPLALFPVSRTLKIDELINTGKISLLEPSIPLTMTMKKLKNEGQMGMASSLQTTIIEEYLHNKGELFLSVQELFKVNHFLNEKVVALEALPLETLRFTNMYNGVVSLQRDGDRDVEWGIHRASPLPSYDTMRADKHLLRIALFEQNGRFECLESLRLNEVPPSGQWFVQKTLRLPKNYIGNLNARSFDSLTVHGVLEMYGYSFTLNHGDRINTSGHISLYLGPVNTIH